MIAQIILVTVPTLLVLAAIHFAKEQIMAELNSISDVVDTLESEVAEASTAIDSAVTLLQGVVSEMRDHAGNRDRILQLANTLDAKTRALAEAVAAGTAAEGEEGGTDAPAPAPSPVPAPSEDGGQTLPDDGSTQTPEGEQGGTQTAAPFGDTTARRR
jgi:hypothetical protein